MRRFDRLAWVLALLPAAEAVAQTAHAPSRSLPELRAFFHQSCASCHGPDGSARSPEGVRLKGRDFTSLEEMKGLRDPDLVKTIRKGLFFGIRMPAFKDQLSEEEAATLVREIIRKAEKGKPIDSK